MGRTRCLPDADAPRHTICWQHALVQEELQTHNTMSETGAAGYTAVRTHFRCMCVPESIRKNNRWGQQRLAIHTEKMGVGTGRVR